MVEDPGHALRSLKTFSLTTPMNKTMRVWVSMEIYCDLQFDEFASFAGRRRRSSVPHHALLEAESGGGGGSFAASSFFSSSSL